MTIDVQPYFGSPICRVQDRFGRGPYRPGFSRRWSDPEGPICLPWWTELGLRMDIAHSAMTEEYHWGCGFHSLDDLHRWFTDRELRALDRLRFRLVWLTPDVVLAETGSQIVFGCVHPLSTVKPRISLVSARVAA